MTNPVVVNGKYVDPVVLVDPITGSVGEPTSFNVTPVGAHSSGVDISSAVTLTKPAGARAILLQTITKNSRFTLDGTTPTSTVGFQLIAGDSPMVVPVPGASIKVIQEEATASLQYQWIT